MKWQQKLAETCRRFRFRTHIVRVINSHSMTCNLWFYSHNFCLSSPNDSYYIPFTKYICEIKLSRENYGPANTLSEFLHIFWYCETEVPTLASVRLSNPSGCPKMTKFPISKPCLLLKVLIC